MCGFGDKDRRSIDLPPVVKLVVVNTDGCTAPERIDINNPSNLRVRAGACNDKTVGLGPFGECVGIVGNSVDKTMEYHNNEK
nr:1552_t:CDS:2 [Entrophospora candida]